jgi:hypothetical protein
MFVFAIALCSASLRAQKPGNSDNRGGLGFEEEPAALTKIYSNLGPAASAYGGAGGVGVAGPLSMLGFSSFVGMPFTPKENYNVKQVRVAIQYGSGANQVELSLYSDASGVPGVSLAGPVTVTNIPAIGTCCALTIANLPAVAVTSGAQYWIVASTPTTGTGDDFEGTWEYVPPAKSSISFSESGGAWVSYRSGITEVAGAVYGTAAGAATP